MTITNIWFINDAKLNLIKLVRTAMEVCSFSLRKYNDSEKENKNDSSFL